MKSVYEQMARNGLRTLAIARRVIVPQTELSEDAIEQQLILLGVVGIMDPPRPEVPDAVLLEESAGIQVIMITGDSAITARDIANQIGLNATQAVTEQELEAMDDAVLSEALQNPIVFARTTPEHKLRIVKLFQSQNKVVAMTGAGVNDAPALKQAEIGIAMGIRGTDVAKEASDIVLTDDNFSSIINAVEESRRQYNSIQKFVRYLLSFNTGEVIAILTNILIGGPLILLPVQILWVNLITDGITAVALGLEQVETDIMYRPPRDAHKPILDIAGINMVLGLGYYLGLATFWLFQTMLNTTGNPVLAQTMAFSGLIMIEKANILNFRALRTPLSTIEFFSNPWLLIALISMILLQVAAGLHPIITDRSAYCTARLG